jgi:Phage integrase family
MTVSAVLDSAGRRRSPATLPGFHAGRPHRNKGMRYPADPPTVEEIVAVMRQVGNDRHGARLRALIVVLWRAGLRIQEALALAEHDLNPGRGSILVRRGKGGRRREVGMDEWASSSCAPGSESGRGCRSVPCSASSTVRRAGAPGQLLASGSSFAGSLAKQAFVAASRPISSATRMRLRSRARACRSTSSSASSATPISARPASTCRGSTPRRSSRPSMRGERR